MAKQVTDETEVTVAKKVLTEDWVELHIETTKNTGNFENVRIRLGYGRNVRDGETPGAAIDKMYEQVGTKLVEKVNSAAADLS